VHLSQVSARAAGTLGVLQLAAALGLPRRKSAQPESERRRQAAALRGASPGKADFLFLVGLRPSFAGALTPS